MVVESIPDVGMRFIVVVSMESPGSNAVVDSIFDCVVTGSTSKDPPEVAQITDLGGQKSVCHLSYF